MEKSEPTELRATVRLIEKGQELGTIEKCFGFVETEDKEEDSQSPTRTIDETITEFIQGIEDQAEKLGRTISKEELSKIAASTIFFLVKRSEPEMKLDVEVEKQIEEKKDADSKSDT